MIRVVVEIVAWLRGYFDYAGEGRLAFNEAITPGTTVTGLVRLLSNRYPKFSKEAFEEQGQELSSNIAVILNGDTISSPAELDSELKEEDVVTLLPKVGLMPDIEEPSPRYSSQPVDGPNKDRPIGPHWAFMMDKYYELMDWDRTTGMPLPETIRELGLEDLVKGE